MLYVGRRVYLEERRKQETFEENREERSTSITGIIFVGIDESKLLLRSEMDLWFIKSLTELPTNNVRITVREFGKNDVLR